MALAEAQERVQQLTQDMHSILGKRPVRWYLSCMHMTLRRSSQDLQCFNADVHLNNGDY